MEFPYEYPFDVFSLSKTIQKEKNISDYLKRNKIKNIILDYKREDKIVQFGNKMVDFRFCVKTTNQNDKTEKILTLNSLERSRLCEFIEYIENISKKSNIQLINKFHNDGYSYDRGEIKRKITMPNKT